MEIIRTSGNLSKAERYNMCTSPAIRRMREVIGQELEFKAWIEFTELKESTGVINTIISIMTTEGEVFATNSKTFISEFEKIVECFENEFTAIKVLSGRSRNGREFITCTYLR